MNIVIASDHGGFNLKKEIRAHLRAKEIETKDFGTYCTNSVDYPDIALSVAEAVSHGHYTCGIIICGTGIGISIAANKVPGIRAALCNDTYSAKMSRQHNDANILALGERVHGAGLALEIVDIFLAESFKGGRHSRRVEKIKAIEEKYLRISI